jgi:hypothetical protein
MESEEWADILANSEPEVIAEVIKNLLEGWVFTKKKKEEIDPATK